MALLGGEQPSIPVKAVWRFDCAGTVDVSPLSTTIHIVQSKSRSTEATVSLPYPPLPSQVLRKGLAGGLYCSDEHEYMPRRCRRDLWLLLLFGPDMQRYIFLCRVMPSQCCSGCVGVCELIAMHGCSCTSMEGLLQSPTAADRWDSKN